MLTLGVCVLFVLQMVDMVVSMMVSFPKGASWNLRNIYGSPGLTRHDIWQAALKTWNLQVPCEDILAEYYGHFKFGVKPVQCHSVFCRLVTKFHKLIGCHGQQVFDFQINLFWMSNTNNLCRRIDKQSVQEKRDLYDATHGDTHDTSYSKSDPQDIVNRGMSHGTLLVVTSCHWCHLF